MSPPTAVRTPRPAQAASLLRRIRPFDLLIAALTVAMILPLSRIAFQPNYIGRMSFDNPTGYDLSVEVSDGGAGWMAVETARKNDTTVVQEVYDIGDVWVFRFAAQGMAGGEVRTTKSQLAADNWNLQIPDRVGAQLQASGAPEAP